MRAEFKTYCCASVDQIEDQDKLAEKQAVLDNHEGKVEDMTKRLEDLVKTSEPVMPHTFDMGHHRPVTLIIGAEHLSRRLNQAGADLGFQKGGDAPK